MIVFLKTLTTIAGIAMSLGYFAQILRMLKTHSSRDVSVLTYIILSIGTTIWFIYGLMISDSVVVISYLISVVGSWMALILALYYRKSKA